MFPLRIAVLRLDRRKRLHITSYEDFQLVADFSIKGGPFAPGGLRTGGNENSLTVGARPAAIVQHDDEIS